MINGRCNRIPHYRLKAMLGKRILIKITLIFKRITMGLMRSNHLSAVEKGSLIKKVRSLLDQDEKTFARNIDVSVEVLHAIEEGDIEVVGTILSRAASLIGVQEKDLEGKRLQALMQQGLDIGVLSRMFPNVPRNEVFDLVNLYNRLGEKHKEKIFHVLKILPQPIPADKKSGRG